MAPNDVATAAYACKHIAGSPGTRGSVHKAITLHFYFNLLGKPLA